MSRLRHGPLLALALLLALTAAPASAASYRVDLILFRDLWAQSAPAATPTAPLPPTVDLRGALDPSDTARLAAHGITVLPDAEFGLPDAWQRLRNSQQFKPLLRLSWVQQDPPAEGGPRLRLASPPLASPVAGEAGTEPEVDGSVALLGGRLLHVDTDLRLHNPGSSPLSLPLHERRRVLKEEMHYLDGSPLGLLVRVQDAETEAPAAAQ